MPTGSSTVTFLRDHFGIQQFPSSERRKLKTSLLFKHLVWLGQSMQVWLEFILKNKLFSLCYSHTSFSAYPLWVTYLDLMGSRLCSALLTPVFSYYFSPQ